MKGSRSWQRQMGVLLPKWHFIAHRQRKFSLFFFSWPISDVYVFLLCLDLHLQWEFHDSMVGHEISFMES